ncbi:MAG: alpha/beta fold hydrolase [Rhodocyclaceae bacterium]|nr:alpha/beta fold hydrolase [Rhodocyclaceae bacterium]
MTPYRPPRWLSNRHAQTLWPLAAKAALPPYRRERWNTPDGDFIDLDWLPRQPGAPLLVLFHGLEGSSRSHYARSIMGAALARGWNGVVPHFRGCSGEPNRLARAYHSGDSAEIAWILARLADRHPGPMVAAGVSLGGNALLKWLGENGDAAELPIAAAMAICPPLDLAISGRALACGFNRIYTRHFLSTLKAKALAKIAGGVAGFDPRRIRKARTLYEFDDAYTGPAHGFDGADDYWRRASARPWLPQIRQPCLLLVAGNDPFVPTSAWPDPARLPPALRFEVSAGGGHVGFPSGRDRHRHGWLARRTLAHFAGILQCDIR